MIWALLATGIGSGFVGLYVGAFGWSMMSAERHDEMKATISRQAYEMLDVRRDRAMWQRRALIAENRLPVQAVREILEEERKRAVS